MKKQLASLLSKRSTRCFPLKKKAENYLIETIYKSKSKIFCPACGSTDINLKSSHPRMPWRCRGCRKFFSIRSGTVMERSKTPLSDWAKMLFVMSSELRSRPFLRIIHDLGIARNSVWFMNHRIRFAYENMVTGVRKLKGKVQVDETAVEGKAKFMSKKTKERFVERGGGQGFAGKEIIAAAKDEQGNIKIKRIDARDKENLQGFVYENTEEGSIVMTDEATDYKGLVNRKHLAVNHSAKKHVVGEANVSGVETFWSTFKYGIDGSFHKISPKHVDRYAYEFAGCQRCRGMSTTKMMSLLARGMYGICLACEDLTADNGMDNFARPVKGSVWDLKRICKNTVKAERKALREMGRPRKVTLDVLCGKVDPLPDEGRPW